MKEYLMSGKLGGAQPPKFFSTHPPPKDRIK
jgi:predicted Zn-dependent protease